MKKAVFPVLSLVFILFCAVFVYLTREAQPTYVYAITSAEAVKAQAETVSEIIQTTSETPLININTAGLDELTTLHGIGDVLGQRIIDYRQDSGAFMTIEELKEVSGIGDVVFERIKDMITV